MRLAARELGARLVRRGVIDARDDVFFLEWPELQALARGAGAGPDHRRLVRERRERFEHYVREKPPDIVRSDGVPVLEDADGPDADGVLRGTGASSGSATGPVRILREPDPAALAEGDVLVVEFADPGWTPLFPRARALVMEVGGIMCHAAVVSRELGIPAVFGVSGATRALKDDQVVIVDGDHGTVAPA
jgi:pyruvate,water dikinase